MGTQPLALILDQPTTESLPTIMSNRQSRIIASAILVVAGCIAWASGPRVAPVGMFFVAVGLIAFSVDYIASWREAKPGAFVCACGYDLRGTIGARKFECPECGRSFP